MGPGSLKNALQQVCQLVEASSTANPTDAQLLELFVRQRDTSAFSVLLKRYGPLVWHVSRRVLLNHHDAEDVFQATFLLLARKAGSIRKRESVASWLHGAAYRLAIQVRRQATRRQQREKQATTRSVQEPGFETALRELQSALDEELAVLPDSVGFTDGSKTLVVVMSGVGLAVLWETDTGKKVREIKIVGPWARLAPDGRTVASLPSPGSLNGRPNSPQLDTLTITDVATGKVLSAAKAPADLPQPVGRPAVWRWAWTRGSRTRRTPAGRSGSSIRKRFL
jgi:RNA polymerase sigma factor (sigma-70 family)